MGVFRLSANADLVVDATPQRKMVHFKRHSAEARINGFLLCLRWLMFGFAVTLLLYCPWPATAHTATCSSSRAPCTSSPPSRKRSAPCSLYCASAGPHYLYWTTLYCAMAEYVAWWSPFVVYGVALTLCILYVMCFGPRAAAQLEIDGTAAHQLVAVDDGEAVSIRCESQSTIHLPCN